jgi:cytochrome c oxidase assembly factor CtaG
MLEHMLMWVLVAPLLAAGAPVRLAFYSLPRSRRRPLARWLHSRTVSAITGPVGSVSLFSAVLLITHSPAVYGLALSNVYVHEGEHGLYLLTSVLVWAPVLGVDPLPHRPGPRGRVACMAACMLPMVLIAGWLASSPGAVYGHYLHALGPTALGDQRLAATIIWAAGLPAFLAPKLARARTTPSGHRHLPRSRQAPA